MLDRFSQWEAIRRMLWVPDPAACRTDPTETMKRFQQQLSSSCSEEPTILMGIEPQSVTAAEPAEVSLVDYLWGTFRIQSVSLFKSNGEDFEPVASTNPAPEKIRESILTHWISSNGPLIRPRLSLKGLSAAQAEELLAELDRLNANLVIPILFNEQLWGFFTLKTADEQDPALPLYLSLYGLAIVDALERRRTGLAPKSELRARREIQILRDVEALWGMLKPQTDPLKLLVVDEEAEAAQALCQFFGDWGLQTAWASSEPQAMKLLDHFQPDLALVDLLLKKKTPWDLLNQLQENAPGLPLFGWTTSAQALSKEALEPWNFQKIFRKPLTFNRLAVQLFEAALSSALRVPETCSGGPLRCLIVDEERLTGDLLKEHLESRGTQAWIASNETETLALVSQKQPDVIVVDAKPAPIGSGSLIQKLRSLAPKSRLIVLGTAAQDRTPLAPSPSAELTYCMKPFPFEQLNHLVQDHLTVR